MLADAGRLSAQLQSAKELSKKSTTKTKAAASASSSSRNNHRSSSNNNHVLHNTSSIISDHSHRSNYSSSHRKNGACKSTTLSPTRSKNAKHVKIPSEFEIASKSLRQKGSLLLSFHEHDEEEHGSAATFGDADDLEFGNVSITSKRNNSSELSQRSHRSSKSSSKGKRGTSGGNSVDTTHDDDCGGGGCNHNDKKALFDHHDNDGNSTVFSFGNHSSSVTGDSYYGSSSSSHGGGPNRVALITTLVMFVGAIGASIFIGYGIKHATIEQQSTFHMHTEEVALELDLTLQEYERAGKWLHQACSTPSLSSSNQSISISRQEFHKIYQYISTSIDFHSIQWMPKVYDVERRQLENESKAYFAQYYPYLNYTGISGLEPIDPQAVASKPSSEWSLQDYKFERQRSTQPYYYPIHYIEPIMNNTSTIEFDAYSWPVGRDAIDQAIGTWQPVVSKPLKLSPKAKDDPIENRIRFLHPGIPLEPSIGEEQYDEEDSHLSNNNMEAQDIAVIVVPIKSFLERGIKHLGMDMTVYLYDSSDDENQYIIGAELHHSSTDNGKPSEFVFLPEIDYQTLMDDNDDDKIQSYEIAVTPTSTWTAVFVPVITSSSEEENLTILLAGIFIFIAGMIIALWLRRDIIRIRTLQDTRRQAERERAALTVKSAKQAAKVEQELNDYIAHEVRNPLAAAMSACSFVKSAVDDNTRDPFILSKDDVTSVREDVAIIDTSLAFMNDLLRSMLDMHKAATKKMKLDVGPVDVLNDIIQPVSAMLYQRSSTFEVITECDENLFVFSDKMRLKQVMLNLARNSSKFVEQGYILLGAHVEGGTVKLTVEDTGPGISKQKQKRLFSKFQESLDLTNQGTGMGLCLCKNIVDLLGGEIWLDTNYKSDIEGHPGSKFVVDLKVHPMTEDQYMSVVNPGGDTGATVDEEKQSLLQLGSSGNSVTSSTTASASLQPTEEHYEKGDAQMIRQQQSSNNPPLGSTTVSVAGEIQVRSQEKDPTSTSSTETTASTLSKEPTHTEKREKDPEEDGNSLPAKMSVLFVDDDLVLRKLFARSLKKAVTGWDVKEAANGETALRMVDTDSFDLIFMDQYMASFEKQLLGTEATRALRAKGVTSLICGLSANDVAEGFIQAGADAFLCKPFPCKPDELRKELARIIKGNGQKTRFLRNESVSSPAS